MMTFARAAGASLLANLQSPAFPVREQGPRRPARSYKNKNLTETAV